MNTSRSISQFGLLVAHVLPGFIGLGGIAPFAPVVAGWLRPIGYAEASLGPPVYAILAAATIGMIVGCVRWFVVDHIHAWTGVKAPTWDDSRLAGRLSAFDYLVENHYRYYQFYANTLVAVVFSYGINRWTGTWSLLGLATDLGVILLCCILFVGSRDALTKYYARTIRLIDQIAMEGKETMTNGNHPDARTGDSSSNKAWVPHKPKSKPEIVSKPQVKPQRSRSGK